MGSLNLFAVSLFSVFASYSGRRHSLQLSQVCPTTSRSYLIPSKSVPQTAASTTTRYLVENRLRNRCGSLFAAFDIVVRRISTTAIPLRCLPTSTIRGWNADITQGDGIRPRYRIRPSFTRSTLTRGRGIGEDGTPGDSPKLTIERQIEARGHDDNMSSMVRCLYFTKTFVVNGLLKSSYSFDHSLDFRLNLSLSLSLDLSLVRNQIVI